MNNWNRETPWRQGHVITDETAKALGLIYEHAKENSLAVVVSHDCDITNLIELEPDIEVIVGVKVQKADGNLTYGKNPRRLHIEFECGQPSCIVELSAVNKRLLAKALLAGHSPADTMRLDPKGISILQRWLAARYRRGAFPDGFVNHLKSRGVDIKMDRVLRPLGVHIRGILFEIDEKPDVVRLEPEDTYNLRIVIVYASEPTFDQSELAAVKARDELWSVFKEHFCDSAGKWTSVELCDCIEISDEALSYAQSQRLKEWRFEHLSLRAEPEHPMLQ